LQQRQQIGNQRLVFGASTAELRSTGFSIRLLLLVANQSQASVRRFLIC